MLPLPSVEAVEGRGLREDARYFRRPPEAHERKRQVSLIDEGTIWRLERRFGAIPRAQIKAQIILEGEVFVPSIVGHRLQFGQGAELVVSMERQPCYAMDLIAPGLREAMESGRQGALAVVTRGGQIMVGSSVLVVGRDALAGSPS